MCAIETALQAMASYTSLTTLLQPRPSATDIVIAGAGIIGLSLALELNARGHAVAVIDRNGAMSGASIAAAGMLAADDPHNPAALHDLAHHSLSLYPAFLDRIAKLSGERVPFQTDTVIQHHADGTISHLAEHSLDTRQLATALLLATRNLDPSQERVPGSSRKLLPRKVGHPLQLIEHFGAYTLDELADEVQISTVSGTILRAKILIHTQGAWFPHAVTPRKGQLLRVQLPAALSTLRDVHRSDDVYIVPRTIGPQQGTAIIGATIENVGFDITTNPSGLTDLRRRAAILLPALADETTAPQLEAWAGLRPGTPDNLPLLGALSPHQLVATGHFRNGILLAPATAKVLADLIEGRAPMIDLAAFNPNRFRTV